MGGRTLSSRKNKDGPQCLQAVSPFSAGSYLGACAQSWEPGRWWCPAGGLWRSLTLPAQPGHCPCPRRKPLSRALSGGREAPGRGGHTRHPRCQKTSLFSRVSPAPRAHLPLLLVPSKICSPPLPGVHTPPSPDSSLFTPAPSAFPSTCSHAGPLAVSGCWWSGWDCTVITTYLSPLQSFLLYFTVIQICFIGRLVFLSG